MYIDAFAIPADARHADAALKFIDFVLRPEVAVELAQATGFAIANAGRDGRLPPELRNNPMIYPTSSARERLSLDRPFSMQETRATLESLAADENRALNVACTTTQ